MYLCAGGPTATEGQKTHQPKLHLDLIVLPGDIASLGIACRGALWRPDLGGESAFSLHGQYTHLVGVIAENSRHKSILRFLVLLAHEKRDRCTGAHRCSRIKDLVGRCSIVLYDKVLRSKQLCDSACYVMSAYYLHMHGRTDPRLVSCFLSPKIADRASYTLRIKAVPTSSAPSCQPIKAHALMSRRTIY